MHRTFPPLGTDAPKEYPTDASIQTVTHRVPSWTPPVYCPVEFDRSIFNLDEP